MSKTKSTETVGNSAAPNRPRAAPAPVNGLQSVPAQGKGKVESQQGEGKPKLSKRKQASLAKAAVPIPGRESMTRQERRQAIGSLKRSLLAEEQAVVLRQATAVAKRTGRPSKFTPEMGDSVCAWVAGGRSLASWCREHRIGLETVYRWQRAEPSFREAYLRAQEDQADSMADALLEIADAPAPAEGLTNEEVQLRRLRIDTRKWIAARLHAKRWGDQPPQQHSSGSVTIQIGIPAVKPAEVLTAVEATPRLDC